MPQATARSRGFRPPLLKTQGVVTLFKAVTTLRAEGFSLSRMHRKPATESRDPQLMIILGRGLPEMQESEIAGLVPFIGTAYGDVAGCSWLVTVLANEATPALEAHIVISCSSPMERKATDNELKLDELARHFKGVNMVRLSLNMPPDLADLIPLSVEGRPWPSDRQ